MGKKGWFYAMKKAVTPSFIKIKKGKRSHKSNSNNKNTWHENQMNLDTCSSPKQAALATPFHPYHPINETDFKLPENEQIKHVDSITYATTISEDAAEVNDSITYDMTIEQDTTSNSCCIGKTREEISAIKIQSAYRGYLARKGFRSLRAMWRLNLWIQGQAVKRQSASTLARIQTMGRVQSQVQARKTRMAQVNKTLQRQLAQKWEKVQTKKEAFDLSPKSKEQKDAILKSKKMAAERREKALAYAHSSQQAWRNSQKPACQAIVDPIHLEWQWTWSNRWDAIRPWETGTTPNKPSSPAQRSKSANPKGSPKSQISKPGPRSLGSPVGLAKKRHLLTNSPSSVAKRSSVAVC